MPVDQRKSPPRKGGRPKVYGEARQQISVQLPIALLDAVDAARGDKSRSALIEHLLREWLSR